MDRNGKLVLTLVLLAVAVVVAVCAVSAATVLGPGAAPLASLAGVLMGGVAWFGREFLRENDEKRRVCETYAAVIELQYNFLRVVLSDATIDRWRYLASDIAGGVEAESFGTRPDNLYPLLADATPYLHLLRSDTIRLLSQWHFMENDILSMWEDLGTRRISSLGPTRVAAYYDEIKNYRRQYRDYAYSTLLALRAEGLEIDDYRLRTFEEDCAQDVRNPR